VSTGRIYELQVAEPAVSVPNAGFQVLGTLYSASGKRYGQVCTEMYGTVEFGLHTPLALDLVATA
jgi:hypothetical protein